MLIDKLESKEYKHIVKDKTNKNYINDVLKKNPDFVFYDYDNECVGDDLIKLIKEVEKKSYEKGFIDGSELTGRIAEETKDKKLPKTKTPRSRTKNFRRS